MSLCNGNNTWISLFSNKKFKLVLAGELFKNKTHTYQTHNYDFSHIETYCLKNGTKHIFCLMDTVNSCFYNTF